MRILVTGGLGTVGRGLTEQLRKRGHHVVCCDLYHQPDEVGFSVGTDIKEPIYARCDIGKFQQIERVFERMGPFDYVYNCAAEFGRWNGEDFYETLWQSNVIGMENIIRLQERLEFRLIHFSSSEVYGDWPELMTETVMDEYEIKQMNDYAMTKWVNEMQIRNSSLQYGTESVVVRLLIPMVLENITALIVLLIAAFFTVLYTIFHGRFTVVIPGHQHTLLIQHVPW